MKYHLATLAVIVTALFVPFNASTAAGEQTSPVATTSPLPAPSFPFSPPEAWHDHSSTALEGALRGTAVLTRAQGEKNLLDSQARIFNEQARSMHYDNNVKFTETQFKIKEMKTAYRELERRRTIAKRLQGKQMKPAVEEDLAQTYRLTQFEFNPSTGAIFWPSALAGPRYAAYRHRIAMLLDQMIQYNVARDPFYRAELARATTSFRDVLRTDAAAAGTLKRQSYQDAQRFIVGLKYTPHVLSPALGDMVAMTSR